jgi:tryptophan synthase alpha chain
MVEIGFPFSDPLADGPTIQRSSEQALKNGMTVEALFSQLADIRKRVSAPILLMGYLNPVLQFGVERFCERSARCGVDGLILPDLPFADYARRYRGIFERHALKAVFLVTPSTSDARLAEIDRAASGFIYAVSSPGVTGNTLALDGETRAYFERLERAKLKNPVLVGFGIHDRASFLSACEHSRGAIIGSALIRELAKGGDPAALAEAFVKKIVGRQ